MANISATKKTAYTITQNDVNQGWATVHVSWSSPFYDTNYVIAWSVEDQDADIDLSYFQGDMHNVTPQGFDAIVFMFSPGVGTAGDRIVVSAMASHV